MGRREIIKSFLPALFFTMVLFLSGVAIPLVGFLLIPLVPQPALALGLKQGKGYGVALLLIVTLVLFFVSGKELALGFSLLLFWRFCLPSPSAAVGR